MLCAYVYTHVSADLPLCHLDVRQLSICLDCLSGPSALSSLDCMGGLSDDFGAPAISASTSTVVHSIMGSCRLI